MPKNKGKTFPPVRVTDKLLEETILCAKISDEYLSDYIRKAVEIRNGYNNLVTVDMKIENFEASLDKIKKQQEHPAFKPNPDCSEKPGWVGKPAEFKTFFKK